MAGSESAIKEIARELRDAFDRIEKYPGTVTSRLCEELRRQVSLIDYYHRYGGRNGWESVAKGRVEQRECSVEGCDDCNTLYLIDGTPFCLSHIPTPITFPIGLHGADYEKFKNLKAQVPSNSTPTG